MKTTITVLALSLAFALPTAVHAQSGAGHAHAPAAAAQAVDVPDDAKAAVSVVDAFGAALEASDFGQVEALLDPAVIILETCGAERSRSEYLGHHAKSDAKFLSGTHSQLTHRTARVDGDTAWVASERELHASKDGKPMTLSSTETMVLANTAEGWRIIHIHWSSRPKK